MADILDVRATKYARSALIKRGIDISMGDVRCTHGVVFIRGLMKAAPKSGVHEVEVEVMKIVGIIKRQEHVKEVVVECTFREEHFR